MGGAVVRGVLGFVPADAHRNPTIWPADEAQASQLLDIFQLEKAFYEIEYELTNRPTWTHIPLDGTWRILEAQGVVR